MMRRDIQPFTPAWHEMRAGKIGGSEVSGLFGLQSVTYGLSEWMLYQIKGGFMARPQWDDGRSRSGRFLEPGILAMAAEQEGWQLIPGGYAVDDFQPRMGASLDAEVLRPSARVLEQLGAVEGMGVVDAKNVDYLVWRNDWPEAPGDPHARLPPYRYQLQVQHQLACTGYTWGALAVLVGGNDLHVTYYGRSEPVIRLIRERVAQLYDRIHRLEEPPIDGTNMSTRAVHVTTKQARGTVLQAAGDAAFEQICAEREAAQAALRAAEKRYAASDNALRLRLGSHVVGYSSTYCATGRPDKTGRRRYAVKRMIEAANGNFAHSESAGN